jgi:hypothetical protein
MIKVHALPNEFGSARIPECSFCYHLVKCMCKRCENYNFLSQDHIQLHLCNVGFMSNYLMWYDHVEVQLATVAKSNENEDEDRMDDMITDIGREYDLGYGEQPQPPEVQNFYMLLAASDEKVHDDIDVIVLQVVTSLMAMKSKYNFSNQWYNNIIKLIINLIPVKHNMLKYLYQSKKILAGLGMNNKKIDVCKKNCILFCKEHKDGIECMPFSRARYVKVVNEDGVFVIIKVVTK